MLKNCSLGFFSNYFTPCHYNSLFKLFWGLCRSSKLVTTDIWYKFKDLLPFKFRSLIIINFKCLSVTFATILCCINKTNNIISIIIYRQPLKYIFQSKGLASTWLADSSTCRCMIINSLTRHWIREYRWASVVPLYADSSGSSTPLNALLAINAVHVQIKIGWYL